jgi:hypothetical protein
MEKFAFCELDNHSSCAAASSAAAAKGSSLFRCGWLRQPNRGQCLLPPSGLRPSSFRDAAPRPSGARQTASDNDENVKSLTFIGGTR